MKRRACGVNGPRLAPPSGAMKSFLPAFMDARRQTLIRS
jgi:hypothetical protein